MCVSHLAQASRVTTYVVESPFLKTHCVLSRAPSGSPAIITVTIPTERVGKREKERNGGRGKGLNQGARLHIVSVLLSPRCSTLSHSQYLYLHKSRTTASPRPRPLPSLIISVYHTLLHLTQSVFTVFLCTGWWLRVGLLRAPHRGGLSMR